MGRDLVSSAAVILNLCETLFLFTQRDVDNSLLLIDTLSLIS